MEDVSLESLQAMPILMIRVFGAVSVIEFVNLITE